MMNNLSERDRRTLKFGSYAAAAIVLFMFVGSPLMDRWNDLDHKIDDGKRRLRTIQADLDDAVTVNSKMKDLRDMATIHPDINGLTQQTAQLLHEVEGLPNYKTISVRRMEGLPLREEDQYYRSAVSLQFNGTLGNLHRFLKDLEKASPTLKVERMSVSADPKEMARIDGQMVISGYAVVLKKGNNG